MNGASVIGAGFSNTIANLAWKVIGVADYNEDGKADILSCNDTTGETYLYLMNGANIVSAGFTETQSNLAWKVIGR